MSPEQYRNPGYHNPSEQSHSKLPAHPDSDPSLNPVNPGESTPGVNLGRREITPGQPSQNESEPKQTEEDLLDEEFLKLNPFLPEWSKLCGLVVQLGDYLKENAMVYFEFPIDSNAKKRLQEDLAKLETNMNLKTTIAIAFAYIKLSEINEGSIPEPLTKFVLEIKAVLEAIVSKINISKEFPYETKVNFMERFNLLMLETILNIDPQFYDPDNALMKELYELTHSRID